jgi:hypothetical protein
MSNKTTPKIQQMAHLPPTSMNIEQRTRLRHQATPGQASNIELRRQAGA